MVEGIFFKAVNEGMEREFEGISGSRFLQKV
jgi:hypothetical protein